MIELRKMENRKFRTFGWVQDPSDFKSLYNVVAIFDNTSEVHKQLVDERIEKLIEEKGYIKANVDLAEGYNEK